jgi:hypothetical protein
VSRQIIWEAQTIDQAAGFLHDDPDGVREMLEAVARLVDELSDVIDGVSAMQSTRTFRTFIQINPRNDECDPASGRGWAVLEEDGSLSGRIFFTLATTQASRRSARQPKAGSEHPSSGGLAVR